MTATLNQSAELIRLLVHSCYQAQQGFRSAAEAVNDATLKRLLGISAQQRVRFAEELRRYIPEDCHAMVGEEGSGTEEGQTAKYDLLKSCVDQDEQMLALYRQALGNRTISTRAEFVISAQLSLMQRAHERLRRTLGGSERRTATRSELALESTSA